MILDPPRRPERFGYLVPVSKILSPPFRPASIVKEDCWSSFLKNVSSVAACFSFPEMTSAILQGLGERPVRRSNRSVKGE